MTVVIVAEIERGFCSVVSDDECDGNSSGTRFVSPTTTHPLKPSHSAGPSEIRGAAKRPSRSESEFPDESLSVLLLPPRAETAAKTTGCSLPVTPAYTFIRLTIGALYPP